MSIIFNGTTITQPNYNRTLDKTCAIVDDGTNNSYLKGCKMFEINNNDIRLTKDDTAQFKAQKQLI